MITNLTFVCFDTCVRTPSTNHTSAYLTRVFPRPIERRPHTWQFTDKERFQAEYPPLMKANNAKFNATMIARVPFRGEGSEKMVAQENCDAYDFAVLIGFQTIEDAVKYLRDEEFGAKQTAVRVATTTGPLAAIKATNKTDGPFPQYSGVPHDR